MLSKLKDMANSYHGENFHLVDREVLLDKIRSLEPNTPERLFLLGLLDNSIKIHKPKHNEFIDIVIKSCEEGRDGDWDCSTNEGKEGFNDMIYLLEKCKI